MSKKLILASALGLLAIVLVTSFSMFGFTKSSQPGSDHSNNLDDDEKVLEALEANGSILSREHRIDFFLYFKDEAQAREADAEIRAAWPKLESRIEKAAESDEWIVAYTARMVPELATLRTMRATFESTGADYDGWGADIERD